VAGAIAEGTTVAWDEETSETLPEHAEIVRGLRVVEQIVSAHRRIEMERHDAREPTRWAHLTIVEKLDQGSFGSVYRAHDDRLNTDVALKLLSAQTAPATRILTEARRLAKIRHPNIVQVYGADDAQHRVGLWMELVKGRTLEAILQAHGAFGAREAALIGLDLCRAMAAVHQAGLIHGDIKARNVMREEGGRIVLMDFGAGRELDDESSTRAVAGTPAYIPPEVLAGGPQTIASDIYALGVLLFHLVTNRYPVRARNSTEAIQRHEQGERLLLRDARSDLPAEFVRIVDRALAADPRERYATAGEFEGALARFVENSPTPPPPAPNRSRRVIAAAAMVVVAAAVAYGVWRSRETTRPGSDAPVSASQPPSSQATVVAPRGVYEIDAAFHKITTGGDERLGSGSRVAPGDRLFFTVHASVPTYLYVVDEPDVGEPYLLFPLPGQTPANPLPANETTRVPAAVSWQVTSAGGREHFVVFASPDRVDAFEQEFGRLGTPKVGQPITAVPLPSSTAERLRGVGGLVAATPQPQAARFASLFTTPLRAERERASGLWIRQLTVDNP
jgi:serine/threonine-protein kinase